MNVRAKSTICNRPVLVASATFVMLATPALSVQATTFNVDSTDDLSDLDPVDGACLAENGLCTLRAAVEQANHDNTGEHVINLGSQTYQLSQPSTGAPDHVQPLSIECVGAACFSGKRISINGTGQSSTRIQVAAGISGRHFYVAPENELGLDGVTIEDGTMSRGVNVFGYPGGGVGAALLVARHALAEISGTTFNNNHVTGAASGGGAAIRNSGILYMTDSTIQDCSATREGGGLYHDGPIAILADVVIAGNSAERGGGVYVGYTAVENSLFVEAPAISFYDSEISNNSARESGAGIHNAGGDLSLSEVEVFGNTVPSAGAGAGLYSGTGGISPRWFVNPAEGSVAEGAAAFNSLSCFLCHGEGFSASLPNDGTYTAEGLINKITYSMPPSDPSLCGLECATDLAAFLDTGTAYSLGNRRQGRRRTTITGGGFSDNTDNCAIEALSPPVEVSDVFSDGSGALCARQDPHIRKANAAYRYATSVGPSAHQAALTQYIPDGDDYNKVVTSIVRPSIARWFGSAIVVDGTRDPAFTSYATPYPMDTRVGAATAAASPADLQATWSALWDPDYLYFFVDVQDNVRRADSADPWEDDSVEIYIDGGNTDATSYTQSDFQYVFRPGDLTVYTGGGRSDEPTAGIQYRFVDAGPRYAVEVAIPWATLGLAAGGQVGLELHVNDDDEGDANRDEQRSWRTTFDDAWTNPQRFTAVDLPEPVFGRFFPDELMTIDGVDSESEWVAHIRYPIQRTVVPINASNNSGSWRAAFDDERLYFFVSVVDDVVTPPDSAAAYDDDSVEIFIDSNNSHLPTFDGYDDFQLIFRAGDGDNVWSFGDQSARNPDMQVQSAFRVTGAGYELEVGITWESLKTSPAEFARMGGDVHVNDDDNGGDREGKASWCAIDNESYRSASYLCTLELDPLAADTNTILRTERNLSPGEPNIAGLFRLDGSGADAIWSDVPLASEPLAGAVIGAPTASGFWRGRWNNEYLYLFVAVVDNEPMVSDSERWWNDDSVEIFIDANNDGGSEYDAFDYQFLFNPSVDEQVQVGVQNPGISTDGIRVRSAAGSGSYSMEIAIPWDTLRITPDELPIFGLEVQVNDDDASDASTERLGKIGWNVSAAMGDVAWQRPDSLGRVKLAVP
jgi:cellulose/xylan binding protein with CBM9 domain/parallel beta helix pectate lyase-like protein